MLEKLQNFNTGASLTSHFVNFWNIVKRPICEHRRIDRIFTTFFTERRDIFRHVWRWIQGRDPKTPSGRNGHVRRIPTFTPDSDATYGHWFHEKASVRRSGTCPPFDSDIFSIPSIIARSPIPSWNQVQKRFLLKLWKKTSSELPKPKLRPKSAEIVRPKFRQTLPNHRNGENWRFYGNFVKFANFGGFYTNFW